MASEGNVAPRECGVKRVMWRPGMWRRMWLQRQLQKCYPICGFPVHQATAYVDCGLSGLPMKVEPCTMGVRVSQPQEGYLVAPPTMSHRQHAKN